MAGFGGDVLVEHKVMLFYSDYCFLPEGLRVIKLRFDRLMSDERTYCKLDYKHKDAYFELTCEAPDSDIIWKIFQTLHNEIIRTEISDGYDFNSKLIAKIGPQENEIVEPVEIVTADPEEDAPLDFQGFWGCVAPNENLEDIIPQDVLLEIAALTCTRLVEDLVNQTIHIYAKSQEDCERVIQKFHILQKYHYLARRFLHHSFFTEGKTDFEVCMPTLSELHTKLVETTLLDPFYTALRYEDLTKVRTVRCCPYSSIRGTYKMKPGGKITPAVPEDATGVVHHQWSGYHYSDRGDESWKQRNVFQRSTVGLLQATGNAVENQNTYDLIDFHSGNLVDIDSEVNILPSNRLMDSNENSHDFAKSHRGIRRSAGISDLRKSSLSESEKPLAPNNSTAPRFIVKGDNRNVSHRVEVHERFQGRHSLLDNDMTETEKRDLPSAKLDGPSGLGGVQCLKTALQTIIEGDEVKGQIRRDDGGTGIADISVSAIKGREHREVVSAFLPVFVAFENIRTDNTTNEFVQDLEESAYTILNSVRNYSGNITLRCHLGRLLIKPFSAVVMHSLQRKPTHPAHSLKDLWRRSFKNVDFAKSITTLPADVKFIQCMEIEETRQPIWSKVLQESSVTYEFICCEHQDSEENCATSFVIEIDAESFATRVRSPMLNFGKVLVHCTLRNWDYVISADGTRNLGETYGDVAQAIKESMYNTPESEHISMSFELDRSHGIHFGSIRLRRRTQHKSYDGRTLLNITEVHDLECTSEASEIGSIFSVTESPEPNSVWYEVDMESVEARIAFRENLSLELADETDWRAEILVQSGVIVKDLCIPANYIVAKIDGVGFHNDNGVGLADGPSNIGDASSLPEQQRPGYHFW